MCGCWTLRDPLPQPQEHLGIQTEVESAGERQKMSLITLSPSWGLHAIQAEMQIGIYLLPWFVFKSFELFNQWTQPRSVSTSAPGGWSKDPPMSSHHTSPKILDATEKSQKESSQKLQSSPTSYRTLQINGSNFLYPFPDFFLPGLPQVFKTLKMNTQSEGQQGLLKSSKDWKHASCRGILRSVQSHWRGGPSAVRSSTVSWSHYMWRLCCQWPLHQGVRHSLEGPGLLTNPFICVHVQ